MANQFLNAQEYANVMLLLLKNALVTGRLVNGQFKNEVTDQNGLTVSVKRPPRFLQKDGATLQAQDILTGSVPVTVDQYKNVHISVGDLEYVQSFNQLMQNESMKSAAATLANGVDSFLQAKALGFFSWVAGAGSPASPSNGTNATDPSKRIANSSQAMAAHTRLMEQGVPNGSNICGTVEFADGELIRGSLTGGFIQGTNKTALERVKIPVISEIDWYATQQCPSLTFGTRTNGAVNGANQKVNYRDVKTTMTQTIAIDGVGIGGTVKKGEVFTIAGVNAWDWRLNGGAGGSLGRLQQFTVTADATADGTGAIAALSISPPIIVQGTNDGVSTDGNTAFATVDAAPADNAVVTFAGTAGATVKVKSAWNKMAIALVSAQLHKPFTGVSAFQRDPDTGISIRYWRGSDISTGAHVHRFDMIYGAQVMDPFLGTRICGS